MLFIPRPDLPFDREDANRYLPWIIAIMTALTGFLMCIGIVLGGMVQDNQKDLVYRVQIQLPYSDGKETAVAEKLVTRLQSIAGVESAEIVSSKETQNLLKPWLGNSIALTMLPIPTIIDIKLNAQAADKGKISASSLRDTLGDVWPGMVVDGYEQWISDFNRLTKSVQIGLYSIASLVLFSAVIIILLITRASVQLHFPIVRLLHRIGAKDEYISQQFQMNATTLTLKGTLLGVIIAAGLFTAVGRMVTTLPIIALPETTFSMPIIVVLLAIPIGMVGCVSAAVHITVRQMLLKMH